MWKALLRTIRSIGPPIFLLIALGFLAYVLRNQWDTLRSHSWHFDFGWLLISLLLMLASWGVEIWLWLLLLGTLGGHIPYFPAVRIWFLSAIVRYIPGNIWQPLSMTLYAQRWRIRPETTVTSVALYQGITLLAATPIAVVYFAWSHNWGLLTSYLPTRLGNTWSIIVLLLLALPVLTFLARPGWLIGLFNWALQKLGRDQLTAYLSSSHLLLLLLIGVVNWLLWGAAFAALVFAIGEYPPGQIGQLVLHLVATYPIAYAIGFLSVITPSGLGVREGTLYVLLAPLLGGANATLAGLIMRLWITLGELVLAGLSALGPSTVQRK